MFKFGQVIQIKLDLAYKQSGFWKNADDDGVLKVVCANYIFVICLLQLCWTITVPLFQYNASNIFQISASSYLLSIITLMNKKEPAIRISQLKLTEKQQLLQPDSEAPLLKFTNFMSKQRNDQLRRRVKNLYGRHYPINFNPSYSFREQWQSNHKVSVGNIFQELLQSQSKQVQLYNLLKLIFSKALLWYLTIFRLLQMQDMTATNIILLMSVSLLTADCLVHGFLNIYKNKAMTEWKSLLPLFSRQIYLILYCSINLIVNSVTQQVVVQFVLYLTDMAAIYLIYGKSQQLLRHFKILSFTTAYKHHFKLLSLLINLLTIQHIFAILMYIVSFYNSQNNWYSSINAQAGSLIRYYYSFYFTCTTMLTIGYGDITPVNQAQILCVLTIQIFGVAFFSYIINQIGYTLSSIRKQEQELEHSIFTLSKMSKYYKLEEELSSLAKSYLIHNQKSHQNIYPAEQNQVLMKLSDDLRECIVQQNSINLVKSSLFFVCNWSKRFQYEIAKRISKKIYNPNQMLSQIEGKERVFLIKSGKLQIYTNNQVGYKVHFKKLLKVIQPNPQSYVSDNVYGYTALLTNRTVKLNAISKDFTCAYFIGKSMFLECVHQNSIDRQYYFELKDKIEAQKFCEARQVPALLNIREHYHPNELFLIKRYVHRNNKLRNNRRNYIRKERRMYLDISSWSREVQRYKSQTQDQIHLTSYIAEMASKERLGSVLPTMNEIDELTVIQNIQVVGDSFQVLKEYQKYFIVNNLSNILRKMQIENYSRPKDKKKNQ